MQLEELTEDLFGQHLNTKFYIPLEDRRVELELVRVVGDKSSLEKIPGWERFSIYFLGPGDFYLPQATYHMEHESLGEQDIFLVPIGVEDKRFRYEAVFSRQTE